MKFIELFAGIGGFRYGLERCSQAETSGERERSRSERGRTIKLTNELASDEFSCVWSNEWDKYAASIYRYQYRDNTLYEGDIRAVDPTIIPGHDIIVGGFPCQSFSIAGKRGGFEDTRGTLFFEICRIARAKRTKYLLLENVKGLLNHDKGNTYQTIIRTLDELGYDCQWQVLNSKNFGVPQNRERVFIIGHLREISRPQVFPIRENDEWVDERLYETSVVGALSAGGHSGGMHSGMTLLHTAYQDGIREYSEVSPTISTPSGGRHLPMVAQSLQTDGQLRQGTSWGTNNPQSSRNIRRLTPIECERLQGFPDNWTQKGIDKHGKEIMISDSQRYKCCGNAVTTNVITAIGNAFINAVV